jgi:hypothetical protein
VDCHGKHGNKQQFYLYPHDYPSRDVAIHDTGYTIHD